MYKEMCSSNLADNWVMSIIHATYKALKSDKKVPLYECLLQRIKSTFFFKSCKDWWCPDERVKKQIFQITVGISLWGKQVNSKYTHISIIGSLLCTMRLQSLLFFFNEELQLEKLKILPAALKNLPIPQLILIVAVHVEGWSTWVEKELGFFKCGAAPANECICKYKLLSYDKFCCMYVYIIKILISKCIFDFACSTKYLLSTTFHY